MTFVMGLLVALAKRILRDELQKLQASIDNACFVADMREERVNEAEKGLVNARAEKEKLNARVLEANHRIAELIEENQRLTKDLSESLVAQNQIYESKRASEKREEDQRAINLELKLRLKKIRELLG